MAAGRLATAVLNSRSQFVLTSLSVVSHHVTPIASILAARAFPGAGELRATLGVVAGAVLQVPILLPGLLGRHFRYRPAGDQGGWRREVVRLLIPSARASPRGAVGSGGPGAPMRDGSQEHWQAEGQWSEPPPPLPCGQDRD